LTSAWWYDPEALARLVFATIAAQQEAGTADRSLRAFVQQFRGLARKAVAQAVCAKLPGLPQLQAFATHEDAVATLYTAMRAASQPPSAEVLGSVGAAHFRACFERWYGVKRFWYDCKKVVHAGMPCVVEVAVAETVGGGDLWTALNFSPTFRDPFGDTWLAHEQARGHGLRSVLRQAHAMPRSADDPATAVAVHVVHPALAFLDRGKTRLEAPDWLAALVAQALYKTTKTLCADEDKRRKDAAKAERQAEAREKAEARAEARQQPKMTLKDAVFQVMWDAYLHASGNEQFDVGARFLYYPVRKMIQGLTDKLLDFGYFSQDLLIEYQRTVRPLPKLYYDPRGVLYEPHTGRTVPLGTREVRDYTFPSWLYDKILYVEKKGVWPILQAARLAERYDLAVCAGEGYASEACRVLFQAASTQQQYQLFVLHDSDPDGYNIARTLQEETARMPGYQVDVIDLGLRWDDAMALGLETETFPRKQALPESLVVRLTATERAAFEGRPQRGTPWDRHRTGIGQRVELNAFSADGLVAYIERRLQETGVRGKVVPPDSVLRTEVHTGYRAELAVRVQREIERLLPIDAITTALARQMTPNIPGSEIRQWVDAALTTHPGQRWTAPVRNKVSALVWDQMDAIRTHIRTALIDAIEDGALDDAGEPGEDEDEERPDAEDPTDEWV